jgi:hypothetical protein
VTLYFCCRLAVDWLSIGCRLAVDLPSPYMPGSVQSHANDRRDNLQSTRTTSDVSQRWDGWDGYVMFVGHRRSRGGAAPNVCHCQDLADLPPQLCAWLALCLSCLLLARSAFPHLGPLFRHIGSYSLSHSSFLSFIRHLSYTLCVLAFLTPSLVLTPGP